MKKLSSILAVSLFTGLIIGLISCKPENEPTTPSGGLSLVVNGVSCPINVDPGDVLHYYIKATQNPNTLAEISSIDFNAAYSTGGSWDTNFTSGANEKKIMDRNVYFKVPINAQNGDRITITIKVIDKANDEQSYVCVINVVVNNTVNTYSNMKLGAHLNTTIGSFYSTSTNLVYSLSSAYNNQPIIDWCYYYYTYGATIAAPTDTMAKCIYNLPSIGLPGWLSPNATLFRKTQTMSQAEFNALDGNMLQSKYNTAVSALSTKATGLFDGTDELQSFITFKTANPVKYGIIRVENVDVVNQATGTITISVKVQK